MLKRKLDFTGLVDTVREVCERSAAVASRAVNVSLTLRNWLVGFYIVEYEQHGTDRAKYGERLLENLSAALGEKVVSRVEARELRRYRRFYLVYPQIRESVTPEMRPLLPVPSRTPRKIRETPSPNFRTPGKTLISALSFSHFAELIEIANSLKRSFYEIECIRGNWSVRQLKRQIASLYFANGSLVDKYFVREIGLISASTLSERAKGRAFAFRIVCYPWASRLPSFRTTQDFPEPIGSWFSARLRATVC